MQWKGVCIQCWDKHKFQSQKQGWRQSTIQELVGELRGNRVCGGISQQKGRPRLGNRFKQLCSFGIGFGHLAGDVTHGLIWFKRLEVSGWLVSFTQI